MFGAVGEFIRSIFVFVGLVAQKSSFPPPLKREEEARLVASLAEGDPDARDRLVEHNLRLVAHIAKKYVTAGRSMDDLISIGTIGLIKAIGTFDPAKCRSVAGYASKCVENEILMSIRSEKRRSQEVSLEDPIGTDRDGNEITLSDVLASDEEPVIETAIKNSDGRSVRSAVRLLLTPQEKRVIELRYGLKDGIPLPQREVGRLLGISRSYVSRIEKRALAKLNSYLGARL